MEDFGEIWLFFENKLRVVVPPYIKYILTSCGYDNCYTIATINEADLEYFARELREGRVMKFYHGKVDAKEIMEGCTVPVEDFVFNRGHQKLLMAIVKLVNEILEVDGVEGFFVELPNQIKRKNENRKNTAPRKRCRYSIQASTSTQNINQQPGDNAQNIHQEPGDDALNAVKEARSTIIRKAILSLITHTPDIFAYNFEQMMNDKVDAIRVEVDLPNEFAHIFCPLCSKPFSVSLSFKERSNAPWWNTSNFHRHVVQIHGNHINFGTEDVSENIFPFMNSTINAPELPIEDCNNSEKFLGIMLQNFVDSAKRNMERKKNGYRFDLLSKMFGSYIFMVAGTLAYETMNANLPLSLPSISTVHRYLADNGPQVIEGEMRTAELLQYLKSRNLPLRVSLSEDATRISAKMSYDPKTNQLIGYALPLDQNGMPIKFSFPARTFSEIRKHFSNPSNIKSSSVYVQMAQPFDETVSPFCLMIFLIDNKFTAQNVVKRWRFQASELKEKGIGVHNISSDGDSRPFRAMKILSKIGQSDPLYLDCVWFSCGGRTQTTFTQDLTHILTKLRNRVLACSRIYPIGDKIVSLSHLKYLIENVSKDKHLLTNYDIEPKDRQNYQSAEKICSENTQKYMLEYVPGSEATVLYLKAMRSILSAYSEINIKSSKRIYLMWYALFFYRAWRSWLLNSEKIDPTQKNSKRIYNLKENFISSNCYTCIELNAHALVKQVLVEDSSDENFCGGENKVFIPDLYSSQPCESLFRQVRSFTSTFSTQVNFNMLEIIHRIRKLQLQSDIINHSDGNIKFPRFEKKVAKAAGSSNQVFEKLNRASVISEIEKAKEAVTSDLQEFGIDTSTLNFRCQVKPIYEDCMSDDDSDLESDSEEFELRSEYIEEDLVENSENESELEMQNVFSGITGGDIMLRNYRENFTDLDDNGTIFLDELLPFAPVVDSKGKELVLRKSTITWYFDNDKTKLSSDRLVRVKEKEYSRNILVINPLLTADKYNVHSQISVGEWVIFSESRDEESCTKMLIGLVLGFTYLDGTTFKAREYSKTSVPLLSDSTRGVGALCMFYTFNSVGVLTIVRGYKHKFINIESYVGTIKNPTYVKKVLTISEELVGEMEKLSLKQ